MMVECPKVSAEGSVDKNKLYKPVFCVLHVTRHRTGVPSWTSVSIALYEAVVAMCLIVRPDFDKTAFISVSQPGFRGTLGYRGHFLGVPGDVEINKYIISHN
jgi:hypothetical protein